MNSRQIFRNNLQFYFARSDLTQKDIAQRASVNDARIQLERFIAQKKDPGGE